jgi:Kef-type K+ transport system membrane component KefB
MFILALANPGDVTVLFQVFIVLVAAKLLAEIFARLKQPTVVGEIIAGVLIGPGVLGWVAPSEALSLFAEIGVIFLLFTVGLETNPRTIFNVGRKSALVAILGVVVPFVGGFLLMALLGNSSIEAMFLGCAMVATSVGVTARILSELGYLTTRTARIILAAAVIDDILGLVILATVSSLAAGNLNIWKLIISLAVACGFAVLAGFLGAPAVKKVAPRIERLKIGDAFFVAGLIVCLGLSVLAAYVGVAAIIGAFFAGMAFADSAEENETMHKQTSGITEFFVPLFLANIGLQLQLSVFRESSVIFLAIVVTIVAIATKFFGCGVAALDLGWKKASQIGIGMVPRGEVGIVVAQLGLAVAVIDAKLFGVVVFMAVATTLFAPPFIRMLFDEDNSAPAEGEKEDVISQLA